MRLSPRAKRRLRRAGCVAGAAVAYCLAHVLLVAVYPDPVFRHRMTYREFTVHMRQPVPRQMTAVLDRVHSLLAASALNDEKLHHHVYVINNQKLARYLFLSDVGFGCSQHLGHTFIVDADPAADLARCRLRGPDDHRSRLLSVTIAHEITHCLVRRHFGWRAARRIPQWLVEGYCDVVAAGSAIDESVGLSLVKQGAPKAVPGLAYFRYRLAVDYLLKRKRLTFDELVRDPPDFEETERKIVAGLRDEGEVFLSRMGIRIGQSPTGRADTTPVP